MIWILLGLFFAAVAVHYHARAVEAEERLRRLSLLADAYCITIRHEQEHILELQRCLSLAHGTAVRAAIAATWSRPVSPSKDKPS